MSTISSFRSTENKHEVKIAFSEFLRERIMEAITCKKKKMKLSTKEQQEPSENAKICYICKEKI